MTAIYRYSGPDPLRTMAIYRYSGPDPLRTMAIYRYSGPDPLRTKIGLKNNRLRECIIDDVTALWCARMCVGEGGENCSNEKASAMLWALMNRWMLYDRKRKFPTYKSLMRAFSQPINPRWQEGGDLADKWKRIDKKKGTDFASPTRLKRRAQISGMPWRKIPSGLKSIIRLFQQGLMFPPEQLVNLGRPRITNWASLNTTPKKFPWGTFIGKTLTDKNGLRHGDYFFEDKGILPGCFVIERQP